MRKGTVSLYSMNGREITSVRLDNLPPAQQRLVLPRLSSGSCVLAGTVNGRSFTRSLVFTGNSHQKSDITKKAHRVKS
jgi:hypothetical protein